MKAIELDLRGIQSHETSCEKQCESTEGIEWRGRYVSTTRTNGYVKSRYSPRDPKYPEASTVGI